VKALHWRETSFATPIIGVAPLAVRLLALRYYRETSFATPMDCLRGKKI